jgi:hypothetical protein
MNDPITTVTYWILWAGVVWGIFSLVRVFFLTILRLHGRRHLI